MVRRSTIDRSPQSGAHGPGSEMGTEYLEPSEITRHRGSQGWRGGGGRWLVWTFRVVAWAVLLIIGYRGVTAIVAGDTQSAQSGGAAAASPASKFPTTLADAYALQFGEVYLNFSQPAAGQRASQLAAFLPAGADSQLGWNQSGSLQLQSEQVAGIDVRDATHAVVTLLARVNGQLMELGVPIYATSAGLVVSGEPAWLAPPSRVPVPSAPVADSDSATQTVLMGQLPAFFQAYASGNQVTLGRFLAPGASLSGLNGTVTFHSIAGMIVPPGGAIRHIVVTVDWTIPSPATGGKASATPASLEMSYSLTVVQQNGTWYVRDVSASTKPSGPP